MAEPDLWAILEALGQAPANAYKAAVPTNVRAYLKGISGSKTPVGNEFFTDEDLKTLRDVASNSLSEDRYFAEKNLLLNQKKAAGEDDLKNWYKEIGLPDEGENRTPDVKKTPADLQKEADLLNETLAKLDNNATTPMSTIMGYGGYDATAEPSNLRELIRTFSNPQSRMKTTIGGAMLERDQDGNVTLKDKYNFNPDSAPSQTQGSLYGFLHNLGEMVIGSPMDRHGTKDESAGYPITVNLGKWGSDVKTSPIGDGSE